MHAEQTETLFNLVTNLAREINMKVNAKKTQLLCIHPFPNEKVTTYVRTNEGNIHSGDSLKILGFNYNTKPNSSYHVELLINKFYSRLWTLHFLKRSGVPRVDMVKAYETIIRPSVEYASVAYHSLIPAYLSDQLEAVQKQAYKMYGFNINYEAMLEDGSVESLWCRREKKMKKFALSSLANPRYGPRWYKEKDEIGRNFRGGVRRKYEEPIYKNKRVRNNPIAYMTRILNEEQLANRPDLQT